jgi:hypothetical protein
MLLTTFARRKNGKTYTIPVPYSQKGEQVTIFTHAEWWIYLRSDAPFAACIRGRDVQRTVKPVSEDMRAGANGFIEHLRGAPMRSVRMFPNKSRKSIPCA